MCNKSFENMIRQMKIDNPVDFETLDWVAMSAFKGLSEGFIEEFLYKFNINAICTHQVLSEYFIRKHSDRIDYKTISNSQIYNLSYDFIFENKHKMALSVIKQNKKYINTLRNTNLKYKTNLISYKYKYNLDSMKKIYLNYKFFDDNNTVILDKALSVVNNIPKYTQIQDTNFFDTNRYNKAIMLSE